MIFLFSTTLFLKTTNSIDFNVLSVDCIDMLVYLFMYVFILYYVKLLTY